MWNLIKLIVAAAVFVACLPYLVSLTGSRAWIWLVLLLVGLMFTRSKYVMLAILLLVLYFGFLKYDPFNNFVNRTVNRIPASAVQRSKQTFENTAKAANPVEWLQNVVGQTTAQGQQTLRACMSAYASRLGRKSAADTLCGSFATDNRAYSACLLTNVLNDPPDVQSAAMSTCSSPAAAQGYLDGLGRNTARNRFCNALDFVPDRIKPYVGLGGCVMAP